MKECFLIVLIALASGSVFCQDKTDENEENYSEKCNCNARQFQERNLDRFNESKYITEYLLDFKVDSGADNKDYVYSLMKDRLSVLLARKIRSKITSVETHSVSEKTSDNKVVSSQDDYMATTKNESNVDLTGTGFRICPDKKISNVYHGVIFINRAQFLSAQLSMYKILLKELETQVNNLSKNAIDYNMRELSRELANCSRKKDKIDQIAIVYSSFSTTNEILTDPEIQKTNENIIPKLTTIRKKVYNRDVEKKVDSAKTFMEAKKFPEAMHIIDQVLLVNPEHEQMKELQKLCVKNWTEESNFKVDEFVRNNDYEGAMVFIQKTINAKIAVVAMNDKLKEVTVSFFNDIASKTQQKIDAKDVSSAKKMLKKIQPYSSVNQQKYDELSKAISKLDW